ncbi:hypothetical protein T12_4428 [Trichinella patagoniensis]|uniref:Uncharacterized protein n=1 Tax=Trichinella patagoniensis TaxID=990121 RepID=A0A0V1AH26_9BILA|nr:hypothetical protein T12_4428 [Trichinella patagoniensis]
MPGLYLLKESTKLALSICCLDARLFGHAKFIKAILTKNVKAIIATWSFTLAATSAEFWVFFPAAKATPFWILV